MKTRIEEKNYIYASEQIIRPRFYVKKIVRMLLGCVFTLLSYIVNPRKKDEKKYYTSICAIFRDEEKYLREWIEFHKIIGIDHFYLYNNFSNDNYYQILKPYIEDGSVTLKNWPVENGQLAAYEDCIYKYSRETNWIGFIDLDEFVVPNKYNNIRDFLEKYRRHSAVVLYWRYFGTSGIMKRNEDRPVVEDFTICWPKYSNIGKCFFNTDFNFDKDYHTKRYKYFHHLLWGKYKFVHYPPVNVFHKHIIFDDHCIPSGNLPIQINHYLLKSYREYVERKTKKGGGTHGVGMHDKEYLFFHEHFSQGTDYHAFKYLVELKLALGEETNEKIE